MVYIFELAIWRGLGERSTVRGTVRREERDLCRVGLGVGVRDKLMGIYR